jgi:DNA-binding response OmpR family regulator
MTPKQNILVVDDDAKVRALMRNTLEGEGFSIIEAASAQDVMRSLDRYCISLVTLDLHLGSEDGLEVAREIRKSSDVPIVMLTGRDDVIDRVVGLEIGADDYITKPFHVREVIARIRSVLRRSGKGAAIRGDRGEHAEGAHTGEKPCFTFDGMTACPDRLDLTGRDGEPCDLTSGEFRLLQVFLERPKRVLSRDQLMDLVSGQERSPLDRTIDNQIARLRRKIERIPSDPRLIKTVRGVGYIFSADVTKSRGAPEDVNEG